MASDKLAQANIEVKCKVLDFDTLRARLVRLGGRNLNTLIQRDVYYGNQKEGVRKKLRIITGGPTELITYRRPEDSEIRTSNYHVHSVRAPLLCHAYHRLRYGITIVVDKKREFWKWRAVRVHFDYVKQLGRFIELEAVVGEAGSEKKAREQCDAVIEALKLPAEEFIAASYSDLLKKTEQ